MVIALLLMQLAAPAPLHAQPPPVPFAEPPQAEFKRQVRALLARVQTDPAFAGIKADGNAMSATIYFKGEAAEHLARYTDDPRISAASVPLRALELRKHANQFMVWLSAHGFQGLVTGIDGRESLVTVSLLDPHKVIGAAQRDRLSLAFIRIVDAVPRYRPE